MNDDERLQKTFEKLRTDDARRAPTFDAVRARRPRRTSPLAVLLPLGGALAVAALLLLWLRTERAAAPTAGVASGKGASDTEQAAAHPAKGAVATAAPDLERQRAAADSAPLDFLLDVPLLRGAPDFDTSLLRGSLR